jgi:hypothetical protein
VLYGFGLFSPAVLYVVADATTPPSRAAAQPRGPDEALLRLPPMLPRNFSAAYGPDLFHLEALFRGPGADPERPAQRMARLLGFPRHRGDVIVLGDTGGVPALRLDEMVGIPSDHALPGETDPLGPTMPYGNTVRFDDFVGGGPPDVGQLAPVPEPGTLWPVGLGIAALLARRSRGGIRAGSARRRNQRQPITS